MAPKGYGVRPGENGANHPLIADKSMVHPQYKLWIAVGIMLLITGGLIGRSILEQRRQATELHRKQLADEEANRKVLAVKAKLDSDAKALSKACDNNWNDGCVKPLAEAGNSDAQYLLGSHLEGKQDYEHAIYWLEKSASQGDVYAMVILGSIHGSARNPKRDGQKAIEWYQRAARIGDLDAMDSLGHIYRDGEFTAQNYLEARRWFLKAAEGGNKASLSALGDMAKNGEGTSNGPDLLQAYQWFSLGCAGYGDTLGRGSFDCSRRDEVAEQLNPADLVKAQALASAWEKEFRK